MNFSLADFPHDPASFLASLHSMHGDIASLETHGRQVVFVFSPELNQTVLSQPDLFHSMFFPVRGPRRSAQRRVTSGLLSINGPAHRQARRVLKPVFNRTTIMRYLAPVAEMTDAFLADWQVGDTRDVAKEMTTLALRITSSILFGLDDLRPALRLGRIIEEWVDLNHRSGISAFLAEDDSHDIYAQLLKQAERIEEELIDLIASRRSENKARHDVLSILAGRNAAAELSDEQLIGHTALLFAAAHLTTAHSLTWTLLLLAQHPHVVQRLRSTDEQVDLNKAANVAENTCLWDRVIKESMRILPASAYSQRVVQEETTLGDIRCQPGNAVIWSQFITHRRSDVYDQPSRFNPDRWLDINPSAYEYLPFGAGPRMCLGGPLALAEMKVILPKIVERFSLEAVEEEEISGKIISTMLSPATPVPLQLLDPTCYGRTVPLQGNISQLVQFDRMSDSRRPHILSPKASQRQTGRQSQFNVAEMPEVPRETSIR